MVAVLRWKVKSEKWEVREGEIRNGDGYDVESADDECADGNICHSRMPDAIENLATIKHSKEETNICRIEEDDMQHMLVWVEGIQVPGEK